MRLKNPNRWLINETKRWTSTLKRYRDDRLIDETFEIMLENIPLEDIIALKLELSSKTLRTPLFGIPLYKSLVSIVRDAVVKFTISTTKATADAAAFLGISQKALFKLVRKYGLDTYYDPWTQKKLFQSRNAYREKRKLNAQQTTEQAREQTKESETTES